MYKSIQSFKNCQHFFGQVKLASVLMIAHNGTSPYKSYTKIEQNIY